VTRVGLARSEMRANSRGVEEEDVIAGCI
jgi:hypothetical protein